MPATLTPSIIGAAGKQGVIAFYTRGKNSGGIAVIRADGSGEVSVLSVHPTSDSKPAWSPDGSKIAFESLRDDVANLKHVDIYIMNADGTGVNRLTNGSEIDYGPAWSPDGTKIAFRADVDGNSDIYVINADGSGRVNLTNHPSSDWAPAWSPDGRLIAFQTNRDGNWEIYVMRSDGTEPTNLSNDPSDDQMPYWQPVVAGTD
jgi:TolB protein